MPPRITIMSAWPEFCQENISGFTRPSFAAASQPASPASAPAMTKLTSL
jgi:hypothetical protein